MFLDLNLRFWSQVSRLPESSHTIRKVEDAILDRIWDQLFYGVHIGDPSYRSYSLCENTIQPDDCHPV